MACAVLNCSSAFLRLVLDGVELAEDHAVFHVLRLERRRSFRIRRWPGRATLPLGEEEETEFCASLNWRR